MEESSDGPMESKVEVALTRNDLKDLHRLLRKLVPTKGVGVNPYLMEPDEAMPEVRAWLKGGARYSDRTAGMLQEFMAAMSSLGVNDEDTVWHVVDVVLQTTRCWVAYDDEEERLEVEVEHAGEGGDCGIGHGRIPFDLAKLVASSRMPDEHLEEFVRSVRRMRKDQASRDPKS